MGANRAYFLAAQTGLCPLAIGLPGAAKTASINAFAKATGRRVYVLIGSLRDPADIGGYPYPDKAIEADGKEHTYMRMIPPQWAHEAHNGEKWIIFLDELTTVPVATQAAMLRVIAEKVVGDLPLPPDTWIIAAANPPGIAANGFELESPMANRLVHLKWEMDWSSWTDGMLAGQNFPAPSFDNLPDNWRDFMGGCCSMVAAFRRHRPAMFEPGMNDSGMLKLDKAEMGGAWPSPRSWTNAATCLAAVKSIKGDAGLAHELVAGCVGKGAADEFSTWSDSLDLADPEDLIAEGIKAHKGKTEPKYVHPNRADKVIATLSSVAAAYLERKSADRWHGALRIMRAAADHDRDMAFLAMRPLVADGNIPKGEKMDPDLLKLITETMTKIGKMKPV